nr:uncharacterized protein LOC127338038 [Lolium perenne]
MPAVASSSSVGGSSSVFTRPHKPSLDQVHAWIFNSKDSVAGNCKIGTSFWGQIPETFNSTSEPARGRTSKQLKDHWNAYNKEVSLFNGYYIQESGLRQSGADDDMVMKAAMERYAVDKRVTHPFRRHHWWEAVRNEAKWKGQHGSGSVTDSTSKRSRLGVSGEYSSGDATTEEERPPGRDWAKAAAIRYVLHHEAYTLTAHMNVPFKHHRRVS